MRRCQTVSAKGVQVRCSVRDRHDLRLFRCSVIAAAMLALASSPALADPEKEAMQARIKQLEERLIALERRMGGDAPAPRRANGDRAQRARATRTEPAPAPAAAGAGQDVRAAQQQAGLDRAQEAPQEAFVFGDRAVTLRPGKFEVSADFSYARRSQTVFEDRAIGATLGARVGVIDGVEIGLAVPWYSGRRIFDFPGQTLRNTNSGIGDSRFDLRASLFKETADLPGVVAIASVTAPADRAPYVNPAAFIGTNAVPIDTLNLYNARGHWAFTGGFQFFKTVDPMVLFGGISVTHSLRARYFGYTFQPGLRFNYNMGFAFSVSDRTTFGVSFIGELTEKLRINGPQFVSAARITGLESASMRFVVVHRIGQNWWVEPSVAFGLTREATDYVTGLTIRRRF
jgi:hypothetical protein